MIDWLIFKICKTPLDCYFWYVHVIICSMQDATEMPDKWPDVWPGIFIYTLLELHICIKEKKLI